MGTRRDNGEGSIRKRKDGTYEARVTIIDPSTQKKSRKSIYAKSSKEIKIKLKIFWQEQDDEEKSTDSDFSETVSKGISTPPQNENDMALRDWLKIWVEDYLADVKMSTVANYRSIVEIHIEPALGNYPLSQLKAPVVQKFYNGLRDKGLSPKYIKNIHGVLHRALDQAVEVEYTAKNYTSICKIPTIVEKEVVPLDEDEMKELFKALEGEELRDMILVDIFTGLRCGELIGLTWDCVDFDNGVIHVCKQLVLPRKRDSSNGKCYWSTLKNGKSRDIVPAPFVMDVLKQHKETQAEQKRAAGSLWNEGDFPGLVFTRPNGMHYFQPNVWKAFQKILKKAGLQQHHRVHDLRHTYAVNSIIAGDDVKTVQDNMGHYSSAFTMDRYGHVTKKMKKNSADRMQKYIEGMSIHPVV